ncbi:MAG: hypothetical protein R2726_22455 [Acidimicrobiales bacterium]
MDGLLLAAVVALAIGCAALGAALVRRSNRERDHRARLAVLADRLPRDEDRVLVMTSADPVDRLERGLASLLDDADAAQETRQRLEWALQAIPKRCGSWTSRARRSSATTSPPPTSRAATATPSWPPPSRS